MLITSERVLAFCAVVAMLGGFGSLIVVLAKGLIRLDRVLKQVEPNGGHSASLGDRVTRVEQKLDKLVAVNTLQSQSLGRLGEQLTANSQQNSMLMGVIVKLPCSSARLCVGQETQKPNEELQSGEGSAE